MGVAKVKVTASMNENLVSWIDEGIDSCRFASRTHALEYAVTQLMKSESSES